MIAWRDMLSTMWNIELCHTKSFAFSGERSDRLQSNARQTGTSSCSDCRGPGAAFGFAETEKFKRR